MSSYFRGVQPSWKPFINQAVSSMVSAGVDMVSDGQTRDPFIHIFTRKLPGCRIRKRPEVIGPVNFDSTITGNDLGFVRSIIPEKKKLLGLIVGPYTLCKSVVDLYYHDDQELAFAFAKALKKEIEFVTPHVDMISIDEPFFSNELPSYGRDLISSLVSEVKVPLRLHVCGDVSSIVSDLVDFPVDILSHEFKATPKLFDVFQEYPSNKGICLGSVRSDHKSVESVQDIVDHIKIGDNVFGEKLMQVSPDCGLRLLPQDVAYEKLKNLVSAKGLVYD
jgi:5-methyltetrahydropteroyltriglutamate--homocysteine methyltransferase